MNSPPDDQLNRLLQDWAESRAVSAEYLASLQRQVQERMAADPLPTTKVKPTVSSPARSNRRFAAAVLGLAAALLIALAEWRGFLRPDNPRGEVAIASKQPWIPAPPALAVQAHLLAEYQEVFGSDFAWLVEQSSRTEVGLRTPDSHPSPGPPEYVAIRLMLFARPTSRSDWKEVQTLNVVARREEVVEVFSGREKDASLTIWAYPLDQQMVSIDIRYEPNKFAGNAAVPGGFTVESSCVQPVGESAPIYDFERDGVEYRLYQSANLIAGKDVG